MSINSMRKLLCKSKDRVATEDKNLKKVFMKLTVVL